MWYVMQVFTGEEETMMRKVTERIDEAILEECFLPKYEEMKRYHGQWHKQQKILFPGYVFLSTENIYEVITELLKVEGFKRVLGDRECMVPLTEAETSFLMRFGGEDHVTEMSIGIIENDKVKIMSGPLMGMEGCIKKIDRHKREAKIAVEMFGTLTDATVGLEVVQKI